MELGGPILRTDGVVEHAQTPAAADGLPELFARPGERFEANQRRSRKSSGREHRKLPSIRADVDYGREVLTKGDRVEFDGCRDSMAQGAPVLRVSKDSAQLASAVDVRRQRRQFNRLPVKLVNT